MGRLEEIPPPQSADDQPPQGYPNHHDNPISAHEDAYTSDIDPNVNTRSYVPETIPQPEAYPPQQTPASYPPQQTPASYPPQQPQPVQFPPPQQPQPVQFPPPQQSQQPQPVQFPPQQQQQQPQPVQFPPQQTSQGYNNYAQPQVNYGGYQTPVRTEGIAVGTQYLAPTQEWSKTNGLFDCAEDPENAIITACFPCITFGQIAEIVDNGQTSCTTSGLIYCLIASFIGIPCIMSCGYRTKIRNRYGLMETPAPDWVTHLFCEWCALCQEYRELKAHGLDPAIGWQGNLMRNQQMQQYPAMTPPTNQRMM